MIPEQVGLAWLPAVVRSQILEIIDVRPRARLGAEMYRVTTPHGTAYLKVGRGAAGRDLKAERDRLAWLDGKLGLPIARVLAFAQHGEHCTLLLSELAGEPSHAERFAADRRGLIELLADALTKIHTLPIAGCPFSNTLEDELREAERRVASAELDVGQFTRAAGGRSPEQTLAWLHAHTHLVQDLVFTHGDYCLPNVLVEHGKISGIVDWGTAGIADRHRDLLGVLDSVPHNCGEAWVEVFLEAYGVAVDPARIEFYETLDWFFLYHVAG